MASQIKEIENLYYFQMKPAITQEELQALKARYKVKKR